MDFGVAFLAGLVVFPVIHSFGLQDEVGASTIGTLFIALPSAFEAMGAVGRVVGLLFFVVLAVGALTSAISLLEVVTASLMDEYGVSRGKAAVGTGALVTAIGVLPALDTDVLGLMDKLVGELLLLAGALTIAVFAGWRVAGAVRDELLAGAAAFWARRVPWIVAMLRYVVPPIVAVVLFFSAREAGPALLALFTGAPAG
jgi:NSS family neurotransmitter:Na+ symporter